MPLSKHLIQYLRDNASSFFVQTASSLATAALAGYFFYGWGYDEGHSIGMALAGAKAQAVLQKQLDEETQTFRSGLQREKEEHVKSLEETVQKRFREDLLAASENGRKGGFELGRAEGREFGMQACVSNCKGELKRYQEYGDFWEMFENSVHAYKSQPPSDDDEVRRQARVIVRVARSGKEALERMAGLLEEDLTTIEKALESGDVIKLKETMETLNATIEPQRKAWQRNYEILSTFTQI
ncbi:MAG: hypothetical protein WC807_16610 [Hyphomicrobium sp.]|jgi:hypothetical protein